MERWQTGGMAIIEPVALATGFLCLFQNKIKYEKTMKRIIIMLVFVLNVMNLMAQTKIIDSTTKLPVAYAVVYDGKGTVVGQSDELGVVNLKKGTKYSISHLGYKSYETDFFCGEKTILMSPTSYDLKDVSVEAKRKKYYHVRFYYRIVEDVNSIMKYYKEGFVDYSVNTKNRKTKLIGNTGRTYVLDSLLKLDVMRSFMVSDEHLGIPYLDSKSLYERIVSNKRNTIDESGNVLCGTDIFGTYVKHENSNEAVLSFDGLYPKQRKVLNLFGYTQVFDKFQNTEVFRDDNLGNHSPFDIKAFSAYRHFTLKHKKEDITKDINVKDEVFIVCSEYSDEKNKNSFSSITDEVLDEYRTKYPLEKVLLDHIHKMRRRTNFRKYMG